MPHSKDFAHRKDPRSRDAVTIGQVVEGLLEEDLFSRGMPVARLASAWPELVGERLAKATQPVSLEGGLLTVRASDGPWAGRSPCLTRPTRSANGPMRPSAAVRSRGSGSPSPTRETAGERRISVTGITVGATPVR